MSVDVLKDGTVGETTLKSGDARLADDALKAAKKCRFQPGKFNGKATSMNFDVKYQFEYGVRGQLTQTGVSKPPSQVNE